MIRVLLPAERRNGEFRQRPVWTWCQLANTQKEVSLLATYKHAFAEGTPWCIRRRPSVSEDGVVLGVRRFVPRQTPRNERLRDTVIRKNSLTVDTPHLVELFCRAQSSWSTFDGNEFCADNDKTRMARLGENVSCANRGIHFCSTKQLSCDVKEHARRRHPRDTHATTSGVGYASDGFLCF